MQRMRYYSLSRFLKETFGEKIKKIPLDAGFSCPNRDGSRGLGGCIYCDAKGSGTGLHPQIPLKEQIEFFLEGFKKKGFNKFIAYFQSFSNTYAEPDFLRKTYGVVLNYPEILGLAIGTRPDCIDKEVILVLREFQRLGYYLWVELGLQSRHNQTLKLINRGHSFEEFLKAYQMLKEAEIPVVVHIIFGLPEETKEMMLETAKTLADLRVEGVKFHALYILEGTPLANLFQEGRLKELTLEDYAGLVAESIGILPPETVIHRLTSDPPREGLLSPLWLLEKNKVLQAINKTLSERSLYQGKNYLPLT